MRGSYWVLMWKPTGKRPLGRHRRRWQYTIKMDLRELGCADVNWIKLAQDRESLRALANAVRKLRVHKSWGNSWLAENWLATQEELSFMVLVTDQSHSCINYNTVAET